MSEFLIALLFDLAVFGLAAALYLWVAYRHVGQTTRLRAFQYRLFALRDRAIRLVAEGLLREDDPDWQYWYRRLNESARSTAVSRMQNGLSFVLSLLKDSAPPEADALTRLDALPQPMQDLVREYIQTVVGICWDGSLVFRMSNRFLLGSRPWVSRFAKFKTWLEKKTPEIARGTRSYLAWEGTCRHYAVK